MKTKPAYKKGKPSYKKAGRKTPGVYIIKQGGQVMYVGYSGSDVHKTAYRHFQQWNDPQQYRATFPKSARLYILPTTKAKALKLERKWIEKFQPKKNTYDQHINLPGSWIIDDSPLPF